MTKVVKTPVVAKTPASSHGPALPLAGAILPLLAALTGSRDSSMLLRLGSGSRLAVNVSTCAAQGPA